jgi:hypothetical protein
VPVYEIIGSYQTAEPITSGIWIERKSIIFEAKLSFQEVSVKPGQTYIHSKEQSHAQKSTENNNYKIMLKYGQIGDLKLFKRSMSAGNLIEGKLLQKLKLINY